MERSNCVTKAVVAVTSVQPTSEKRTVWQLTGSRLTCGAAAAPAGGMVAVAVAVVSFAAAGNAKAARSAQPDSAAARPETVLAGRTASLFGGLTGRPWGRHD